MQEGTRKTNDFKIAAAVVLFRPPESVIQNIETYRCDVGVLYVFDNSPWFRSDFAEAFRKLGNVKYLTKGINIGIAAALNIAAHRARDEGYHYLLTMDQDSAASDEMLARMFDCIDDDETIGLITPFHQDRNAPKLIPENKCEPLTVAMSSGSLLNLQAHNAVGGFTEKLFIDYVDTEYCLRLKLQGFRVIRSNKAILTHSLGNFTVRKFFGRTVYPYNHSPIRLYYQSRNRFYLRRLYGSAFPDYFRYDLKLFLGGIVKIILYEEQPLAKLAMVIRGLIAFVRNDFSVFQSQE